MGQRAGELLYEQILGRPVQQHLLLETELIVRASSVCTPLIPEKQGEQTVF
jgi:DNA-binding LacI/PurR family transcriptional regulator